MSRIARRAGTLAASVDVRNRADSWSVSITVETVLTFGSSDVQNRMTAITEALGHGAIGHWVDLRTGQHRAFLTRDRPPGFEVTRITPRQFSARLGEVERKVAEGETFEVAENRSGQVRFYVCLTGPEELVTDGRPLRYCHRARRGTLSRLLWSEFTDATTPQAMTVP